MKESYISSSVAIDIESLVTNLKDNSESSGSICKVKIRVGDASVYEPIVVSIGPYHHGKKNLQLMEKKKWNWIDCILKQNTKRNLHDYIESLKKVEHLARSYYGEEIDMASNEFIRMLLLDGLFILISLLAIETAQNYQDLGAYVPEEDPDTEFDSALYYFVVHDILLVENQIPFFVLQIIYKLFIGEENAAPSLSEKISNYIEQLLRPLPIYIDEINRPRDFHHLLHMCHLYLKPSRNDYSYFLQLDRDSQAMDCLQKAVRYHDIGVDFRKKESDENNSHSLLDMGFTDNILEIPYLIIEENTFSLFKNLIALEQTNAKFGNDITTYIIFMSRLVNNATDVALLINKGIIEHDLRGGEEVVDFFARLREGIVFDFTGNFYLRSICNKLEAYYQSRSKKGSGWFRRTASTIVRSWVYQ